MKPRVFIVIIGFLFVVASGIVGWSSASISQSVGRDEQCGSAFSPSDHLTVDFGAALGYGKRVNPQGNAERCADKLSSRRVIAIALLAVGVLTMVGGGLVGRETKVRETAAKPELQHIDE